MPLHPYGRSKQLHSSHSSLSCCRVLTSLSGNHISKAPDLESILSPIAFILCFPLSVVHAQLMPSQPKHRKEPHQTTSDLFLPIAWQHHKCYKNNPRISLIVNASPFEAESAQGSDSVIIRPLSTSRAGSSSLSQNQLLRFQHLTMRQLQYLMQDRMRN